LYEETDIKELLPNKLLQISQWKQLALADLWQYEIEF